MMVFENTIRQVPSYVPQNPHRAFYSIYGEHSYLEEKIEPDMTKLLLYLHLPRDTPNEPTNGV